MNAALEVETFIGCQQERLGPKLVVVRVHSAALFLRKRLLA
jgi:hypothetical protein